MNGGGEAVGLLVGLCVTEPVPTAVLEGRGMGEPEATDLMLEIAAETEEAAEEEVERRRALRDLGGGEGITSSSNCASSLSSRSEEIST